MINCQSSWQIGPTFVNEISHQIFAFIEKKYFHSVAVVALILVYISLFENMFKPIILFIVYIKQVTSCPSVLM